jgi:hypothetical protein
VANIEGECFDLSNPIEVEERFANGGTISTSVGSTVCVNTLIPVSVSNSAGANGQTVAWVITDVNLNILNITTTGPFSFAAPGTYVIWRLGYVGQLNGAMVGANAGDLTGDCFDLSNPLFIEATNCGAPAPFPTAENTELIAWPNPTSGFANVLLNPGFTGRAILEVYDLTGKLVTVLLNQEVVEGVAYQREFDGTQLPNGVYIYRLTTPNGITVKKFLISR